MSILTNQVPGPANQASVVDLADRLVPPGGTLVAVWAHPDDESYLGAGLMTAAADAGARVVSVSATLGERGTDDPTRLPPARLARVRGAELGRALDALGAGAPILMDYPDGGCAQLPVDTGAAHVGRVLDEVGADAVLTFDRDGVTGHPDHRAVAAWTRTAVAQRGDRIPLVTTVLGAAWPHDLVAAMQRVSMFYPGYPQRQVGGPYARVALGGELLERKLAALQQHRSQIESLRNALGPDGYRRMAAIEAYRPANEAAGLALSGLIPSMPTSCLLPPRRSTTVAA
jgi:LmbE family N-acetylglucosaminyl deacetylase